MSDTSALYIGLLSGTSLDSIDAALVDLSRQQAQCIGTIEYPIAEDLRHQLIALCQPGDNEIDRLGPADRELGAEFAKAVNSLLAQHGYSSHDIVAIGSHGQTIRHRPEGQHGFTLQIGDPNTIAFETGISVVADFRRCDIAANGQGAPLAPAYHRAALSSTKHNRAIVNIGGMANITYLGCDGECSGFDTGPGNILLDSWIQKNLKRKYDDKGQWAACGKVLSELLTRLLSHSYLQRPPPKSTGREDFNLDWLHTMIGPSAVSAEDVQATLLEFTAQTIVDGIKMLSRTVNEVYICGGGAYNTQLMIRLETLLNPRVLASTDQLGIPPQWVEAIMFAWLAKQTMAGLTGNVPNVTGANAEVILGSIYPRQR
jgi:anhydro-N-acetylmuramic acid kinase